MHSQFGLDIFTPARHLVVEQHNLLISMRDQVRLACDIYFPAHGNGERVQEPLPVVLLRTPYNKAGSVGHGRFFASRGFIYVAQDVRGCWESEGTFIPFAYEGEDGYDTFAWLNQQPWCNGKIGTIGCSYCAAVQSASACLAPPGLTTMIVQCGPANFFDSSMRHNGALEQRFLFYAFNMAASSKAARQNPAWQKELQQASSELPTYLRNGPIRPGCTPLALLPNLEQWAIDLQTRGTYDEFWKLPGFGPQHWLEQHADVPTMYLGGWYDTYARGTLENAVSFAKRGKAPIMAVMGPWTHGTENTQLQNAGDADFGQQAKVNYLNLCQRWLGQWLKNEENNFPKTNRVDYFVMGTATIDQNAKFPIKRGGDWRQAETWPPPTAQLQTFYLQPNAGLAMTPPCSASPSTTFMADPENPVPTIGGSLSALPLSAGCYHQIHDPRFGSFSSTMPLSARNDVVCFCTEPLAEDLVVAGPVVMRLYVATDGLDTDFTAKLVDVCPPEPTGNTIKAVNITDSIQRLRYRNGYDREEEAIPGKTYLLEFKLFPTACRFGRGHRLRVDIASSNFPRFDVNPNTGEPVGQHRRQRRAQNTVFHSAEYPSALLLHVLPD